MDYYFLLKSKTEEKNCSFLLDYLKFYDNKIVKLLSNCTSSLQVGHYSC